MRDDIRFKLAGKFIPNSNARAYISELKGISQVTAFIEIQHSPDGMYTQIRLFDDDKNQIGSSNEVFFAKNFTKVKR